jgi:hypothetical protein
MPYVLDGKTLPPDTPFVHGGFQYPANWLACSTPEEREALGIVWRDEAMRPDDRFYWVEQNPDGTYTATPRDVDVVREEMIAANKQMAYLLLQPTDWMVIRAAEGVSLEPEIKAYRHAVRVASNENELTLNACTTIEELAQFAPVWPEPVSKRKAK